MAEWIRIPIDGLSQSTKVVGADGHRYALFHIGERYYAIDDTCTHEEASLSEGTVYDDEDEPQVECPKHGAIFDIATGEVRSLPAVRSVNSYEVQVDDGFVRISTEPKS
jgi:3-phenylpropionate/trans-cinnamate dioxygenase ferredoxin subunit